MRRRRSSATSIGIRVSGIKKFEDNRRRGGEEKRVRDILNV